MAHTHFYRFKHYDPLRRKWIDARYRATEEDIKARYEKYELVGEPEIRAEADPAKLTAGHLAQSPKPSE